MYPAERAMDAAGVYLRHCLGVNKRSCDPVVIRSSCVPSQRWNAFWEVEVPDYVEEFRFDERNDRIVVPLDGPPALRCGRSNVLCPTGVVVLVGEVDAPDSVCEVGGIEKRRNTRLGAFDVAYFGGIVQLEAVVSLAARMSSRRC